MTTLITAFRQADQAVGIASFPVDAFNGVSFIPDANNQLSLMFSSITFVIPPEFLNSSAIQIPAPFTFSGHLSTILFPMEPVTLSGEGTVNVLLVNRTIAGFNGFFLDHADYVFGPRAPGLTIEPTPEPATIFLLASGLAGALLRLKNWSTAAIEEEDLTASRKRLTLKARVIILFRIPSSSHAPSCFD